MPAESPDKRKLLLIGWDAADWMHINPLLEEGLMPTLDSLINEGVMGNLATLQPVLSPMLWTSIATGMTADKHGVLGFVEQDPKTKAARPWSSTSRKVKAIWNILNQKGYRTNLAGWLATHPAEPLNGRVVSTAFRGVKMQADGTWTAAPGTMHPEEGALKFLRLHMFPEEVLVSDILPFIPDAVKVDQTKDDHLQIFAKLLAECASVHAVSTTMMEEGDWDFTAVYFDSVDHFCHNFMQFHPPKMDCVSEEQFQLYKDVIRGVYRFHDMMLQRQLELAGPDATVILCSDHGFLSDHRRPQSHPREPAGPTVWHRDLGIIVMKGPGIKKDERIYGASLLDITPTILHLCGLPIGEDMDGKPLLEALEKPGRIRKIPTWEEVPGDDGRHPEGFEWESSQNDELTEQFVALGYVDDHADDLEKGGESADLEGQYNLAQVHLSSRHPERAIPVLENLLMRRPWENRFINQLVTAYQRAGLAQQAEGLVGNAYPGMQNLPLPLLLALARIKLARADKETALEFMKRALELDSERPTIHVELGNIYLDLKLLDEAAAAYGKALSIDRESAAAHQGIALVCLRRHENEKAVDSALEAIRILYQLPRSHFALGVALTRLGWPERAAQALQTAVKIAPRMVNAHRLLSALYRQEIPDETLAKFHRVEARKLIRAREKEKLLAAEADHEVRELPDIPHPRERLRRILKERPPRKRKDNTPSGKTFVIVSGLPRSGTSLMMQMLQAGGLPPLTDGERTADDDNPEGYFEWEAIKEIDRHPELLDEEGHDQRAIKVISMLLGKLPLNHCYKIVFMARPTSEIALSQRKMLARRGSSGMDGPDAEVARRLETHRLASMSWLERQANVEFVEIDFPSLVQNPTPAVEAVSQLIGPDLLPRPEKMAALVRPELHRNRMTNEE